MATYTDISNAVKDDYHVTSNEVDAAAMLNLVKSTAWELMSRNILIGKMQESAVATEIVIATGMLYLKEVIELDNGAHYLSKVQGWRYNLFSDGATPTITFTPGNTPSNTVRLNGLGFITEPSALGDTVPEGFEGIFQQGLAIKVLGRLSIGQSAQAQARAEERREAKVVWEETLGQMVGQNVSRLMTGQYVRIPGR